MLTLIDVEYEGKIYIRPCGRGIDICDSVMPSPCHPEGIREGSLDEIFEDGCLYEVKIIAQKVIQEE
mgnify:CR=1 FL=1